MAALEKTWGPRGAWLAHYALYVIDEWLRRPYVRTAYCSFCRTRISGFWQFPPVRPLEWRSTVFRSAWREHQDDARRLCSLLLLPGVRSGRERRFMAEVRATLGGRSWR
jgi:hypothetical protein